MRIVVTIVVGEDYTYANDIADCVVNVVENTLRIGGDDFTVYVDRVENEEVKSDEG